MNKGHDLRMEVFQQAGLYLVTSKAQSAGRPTLEIIAAALAGGCRLIQLREKDLSIREYLALAMKARSLTAAAGALLLVNDRIDVAMAVGADGVHLGQDDFPICEARRLAPDLIIGASSHSTEEARQAQADGASYVNIGPLFPTNTKIWTGEFLGLEGLRTISAVVSIPFTVMGGIKEEHIPSLKAAGATTVAVVSAVTAEADVSAACRRMIAAIKAH